MLKNSTKTMKTAVKKRRRITATFGHGEETAIIKFNRRYAEDLVDELQKQLAEKKHIPDSECEFVISSLTASITETEIADS